MNKQKNIFLTIKLGLFSWLLLFSTVGYTDGFGWYALLFDERKFNQHYGHKLKIEFIEFEKDYQEQKINGRYSDWVVIDFLEANAADFAVENPQSDIGELLSHGHLMYWTSYLAKSLTGSPLKRFATGSVYVGKDKIEPCPDFGYLIHGDCRTVVLLSADEVESVFWAINEIFQSNPNGFVNTENVRELELIRIYRIIKEAMLKKKGVYFYGHD